MIKTASREISESRVRIAHSLIKIKADSTLSPRQRKMAADVGKKVLDTSKKIKDQLMDFDKSPTLKGLKALKDWSVKLKDQMAAFAKLPKEEKLKKVQSEADKILDKVLSVISSPKAKEVAKTASVLKGNSIKGDLIRLAHSNPGIRADLLPLVKSAERFDPFVRTWPKLLKDIASKVQDVTFRGFLDLEGDNYVVDPDSGVEMKIRSLKSPGGIKLRNKLFKQWRSKRVWFNRKLVINLIARNTGKKVSVVKKEVVSQLRSWAQNPLLRRLAIFIVVALGLAGTAALAGKFLANRAFADKDLLSLDDIQMDELVDIPYADKVVKSIKDTALDFSSSLPELDAPDFSGFEIPGGGRIASRQKALDASLRKELIKIAYETPKIRKEILSLLSDD